MRPVSFILLLLLMIVLSALSLQAQTCNGSLGDPVFNQTFGAGTTQLEAGPPLPNGVTTLQYTNNPCGEDGGYYGLVSFMQGCHANTWQHLNNDHTGNAYGYFMLINGPSQPEVVYSEKVAGSTLCPNTTYEFSAWIMNVLILSANTANWVPPNLTLSIETASGTVLKAVSTGDIPETTSPVWNEYFDYFTSPADGSDVYVKIYDNQTLPGNGNDFAVDDIVFRPCGPIITAGFNVLSNTANQNICAGQQATFTMVGAQQGYDSPAYQWQINVTNDSTSWTDIPGANSTSLVQTLTNPAAGVNQYRLGVQNGTNSSIACRIYSKPLVVDVNPYPDAGLQQVTSVCAGQLLQFYANQGDSYAWTGPNGFTSTVEDPAVTESVQATDAGVYKVTITLNGCSATDSTIVKVYSNINAIVSSDTTICQGDPVTLSAAQSTGATTYYWTSSASSDTVKQATVTFTPSQTTTYTVNLGNGGCFAVTQSVTVTVVPKPVANAGPEKRILSGESVALSGTITGNNVQYYWTPAEYLDNPNSLTPLATPPDNIYYTLHAISADNCGTDTSTVYVRVFQKVTIPNTFTPNGDGVNDYWDIKNLSTYPKSITQVYNRYGQPVFQSNGYPKPWDGTSNGAVLPTGTYYYIIDLKNGMSKLSGWVLIVR